MNRQLHQAARTLTHAVITGHRAGHRGTALEEMAGSVAGHDGAGVKSHRFHCQVLHAILAPGLGTCGGTLVVVVIPRPGATLTTG
jgi:hypothetical protein